ncbi:MAG: A24 family peptidase [Pirellulales bacterium]|nr:A24 family peptidase [Pirellulales bacterium]
MQNWLELSLTFRLLCLGVVGLFTGQIANWAICRWRIQPLDFHPWSLNTLVSPKTAGKVNRHPLGFLPLLGWWLRRGEGSIWGRGFWIRPLLVELLLPALWITLYLWQVENFGQLSVVLHPALRVMAVAPAGNPAAAQFLDLQFTLHCQFAAHALLSVWMLAATLIDWDELIIPDEITVSGTILALLGLAIFPRALLPDMVFLPQPVPQWLGNAAVEPVTLTAPNPWPDILSPRPNGFSLVLALVCYSIWCVSLLPWVWHGRYGLARAWRYFWATLYRDGHWRWVVPLLLLGNGAICGAWAAAEEQSWRGLLSSLVGLWCGGFMIWIVRAIGFVALRREAMGFGDVTLMSMIGAVTGWQATILIFFLAPVAGLILGVIKMLFQGERVLPFGPFLCLATWTVLFAWSPCWEYIRPILEVGWLLPAVLGCCLPLLGLLLGIWRWLRGEEQS